MEVSYDIPADQETPAQLKNKRERYLELACSHGNFAPTCTPCRREGSSREGITKDGRAAKEVLADWKRQGLTDIEVVRIERRAKRKLERNERKKERVARRLGSNSASKPKIQQEEEVRTTLSLEASDILKLGVAAIAAGFLVWRLQKTEGGEYIKKLVYRMFVREESTFPPRSTKS